MKYHSIKAWMLYSLKNDARTIILSLALATLALFAQILLLLTSGFLLAAAALQPSIAQLHVPIVGVRFFGISRAAFRYADRLISHAATFTMLKGFRLDFFNRIYPQAPAVFTAHHSSFLFTKLMRDNETLENIWVRCLLPSTASLIMLLAIWLSLLFISPLLSLYIFLCQSIFGIMLPMLIAAFSEKKLSDLEYLYSELNIYLSDYLNFKEEALALNNSHTYKNRINAIQNKINKLNNQQHIISALEIFCSNLAIVTAIIAIIYIQLHSTNSLNNAFLPLLALASQEALQVFAPATHWYYKCKQALIRMNTIANWTSLQIFHPENNNEWFNLTNDTSSVNALNVNFCYPQALSPCLQNFTFAANSQQITYLKGASGSGKSTLLFLLLGYWKAGSGTLTIGKNTYNHNTNTSAIPTQVALIRGEDYIFTDTVRNNILLTCPKVSDAQILAVAQKIGLLATLEQLPQKLDTLISKNASYLSGGERQLLLLMRLFCREANIIALDETFSHLDSQKKQLCQSELSKQFPQATFIIVSHA